MSDKVKSELLLDYVGEILPPKYDVHGLDIGLKSDIHYHNKSCCYYSDSMVFLLTSKNNRIK